LICRLYQKELSAYLDGELAAVRAARLEAHLRTCPHCRGELNSIIGISSRVKAASREVQVGEEFDQRVLRAVGYLETGSRQVVRRSPLNTLLLAVLALLASFGLLWRFFWEPPAWRPQPQTAVGAVAPAPTSPGAPVEKERRR
jgi:anti-sigma factor RsiW